MPIINKTNQTIDFKIVYYGPAAAGKASSLHYLHSRFGNAIKSTLDSSTADDVHTISLACVLCGKISLPGYTVHLHLITKSGAVLHESARVTDLQDCDGIIFVADSQRLKLEENISKVREMAHGLRQYARSVRNLPIVFQYNKRDLPAEVVLPVAMMDSYLNPVPWPRVLTVAAHYPGFGGSWKTGDGVMEAFDLLFARVVAQVQLIHSSR